MITSYVKAFTGFKSLLYHTLLSETIIPTDIIQSMFFDKHNKFMIMQLLQINSITAISYCMF